MDIKIPQLPDVPDFIKGFMPNFETEVRQHMANVMEGAVAEIDKELLPTRFVQEQIANFGVMAGTSFLAGAIYTYAKFSDALTQASKAQSKK